MDGIEKLINQFKEEHDINKKLDFCLKIVIHYVNVEAKMDVASAFLNEYLKYSREVDSLMHIGHCYRLSGLIARREGDFQSAFRFLSKALLIYNELNLIIFINQTNQSIGIICLNLKAYETALDYFNKVLENIATDLIDKESIYDLSSLYINMGICYDYLEEKDTAYDFFQKSINCIHDSEDTLYKTKMEVNLAYFYEKHGEYEKAWKILINALKIFEDRKVYISLIHVYVSLIKVGMNIGEDVLKYFDKVNKLIEISKYAHGNELLLEAQFKYYEYIKEFEKAFFYLKKFNEFNEKVYTEKVITEIGNYSVKNELSKVNEQNKDLINFTRILSHDLNEPLRMMTKFSKIVISKTDINKIEELHLLNFIKDNGERMQGMIDDLLQLTKLENEVVKLVMVDLNEIIESLSIVLKLVSSQGEASIQVHEKLPKIKTSKSLLFQLLQNLMSNGIKYNKSSIPKIIIKHKISKTQIHISIIDNGIGINEKMLSIIFKPFKRLSKQGIETKGTGLGLSICKRIVEKLNGSIEVKSKENVGSNFTIVLPLLK